MPLWSRHPAIFEINTWAWLSGLKRQYGDLVTLDSVPPQEWDAIGGLGFDAVWLMGVWERSPAGIAIANRNQSLLDELHKVLPDFALQDNVGSPYCVRNYSVDPHFGGPRGLKIARSELARRGMRLLLDFVPNHVAPDHPWVSEHPEYFIRGTAEDLRRDPASFLKSGQFVFACGRDPYFPAWQDVLQLNAYHPGLREAVRDTVLSIAAQCDGVRCDMAMLMLSKIVERTWGLRAGQQPETEYWMNLIPAIKRIYPDFIFIAEAYWDLEWELQQKGFDFCYDKRLYDRLEQGDAEGVRLHLGAEAAYQEKLVRFLENHDERRAAAVFPPAKERAAAITTYTQLGAKLFHEGQIEGRQIRVPVFLGRRPDEPVNAEILAFYRTLLKAISNPVFRGGQWSLCPRIGWPDNQSFRRLVAWNWTSQADRYIIVVNLSEQAAQGRVQIPWDDARDKTWRLTDSFSGVVFDRCGTEMHDAGLYVDLPAWNFHFLQCRPL
jgi:hypothetical protein